MTELFWPMLAAVLGGNLLTVMFVWAGLHISKREQTGESPGFYVLAMIMPLLFAVGAMYIAFGGT